MQFHSYPEYISIKDYQKNVEVYSTHLKNLKEVWGLFSMGSISAPGLSDIDLIVVVDNLISHAPTLSPMDLNLDRRLFTHDVFVLSFNLVNHFNYIFYPTNIKPIFIKNGIHISFPFLLSMSKELKLIYLIELGKMRLDQLCAISRSGHCNVRKLITRLSSIIHSLNIADALSIKIPDDVYAHRDLILSLRNVWTKNKGSSIQHIEKIFTDGLNAWCGILEAASHKLSQMDGIVRHEKLSNRKFMNMRFSDQNCCRLVKNRHGFCQHVVLPKNIYYHYEGYKRPGKSKYRREQNKRLRFIRAHRRFLNKTGLTYSMTGNSGIPLSRMEKISLIIKGLKIFKSCLSEPNVSK
jgi:hypothetical protein